VLTSVARILSRIPIIFKIIDVILKILSKSTDHIEKILYQVGIIGCSGNA
jgi:hypothetical protein